MKFEEASKEAQEQSEPARTGINQWAPQFRKGVLVTLGVLLPLWLIAYIPAWFHPSPGSSATTTTTVTSTVKSSTCPESQRLWVGNDTVKVRTATGCQFLFQRADVGPDLRIWVNGDRSTERRWTASGAPPHFDEVTSFAEVELWTPGTEEVETLFSYPEK